MLLMGLGHNLIEDHPFPMTKSHRVVLSSQRPSYTPLIKSEIASRLYVLSHFKIIMQVPQSKIQARKKQKKMVYY